MTSGLEEHLEALRVQFRIGCMVCGRNNDLLRCAGCQSVFYCGAEHQKQDWKAGHRAQCKDLKSARSELAEDGPMDEARSELLLKEVHRINNTMNAPHMTPEKKLALATRAKLICEDVMQWPRHLSNRHWPDFISQAFSGYASAFVDCNLEDSPESCRSVVEQMNRQCVEYHRWAYPSETTPKPRMEYASLFGTMAQVESHVGNHEMALTKYRSTMIVYDGLFEGAVAHSTKSFVRELQANLYGRMMNCANELERPDLVDEFYDSASFCAEGIAVPEMPAIRMDYVHLVLTRIDDARYSTMMAAQQHGDRPPTPEILASMKRLKSVVLRNNKLLEKALTLATRECKLNNDFATWSRAMGYWLKYHVMSYHKSDADECARLVLKMHPCARGVLCTDALEAKETLRVGHLSDIDVGRITSAKEGCYKPVAREWERYRKEK
ncbi:hypothetical protein HDU98_004053 [Podochytrium sp. JEL0797]|nr:hypothetical protein HDU98_004053 [Podochytrium sp. JEL0797]